MVETTEVIRSAAGRFLPGHPYMGGDTIAVERKRRTRLISDATTDEQVLAVWKQILEDALHGSVADKQMVLAYLLGKPDQIDAKEAVRTYDAVNLNKPSAELTAEQRKARLAFLLAEQAKGAK